MQEFSTLTRFDFESRIKNQDITALQIISIAMVAGVLLLLFVMVFLHNQNADAPAQDMMTPAGQLSDILVLLVVAAALILYPVVYYLPSWQLQRERLRNRLQKPFSDQQGNELTDPVAKVLAVVKNLFIIRIALMETVALVGLVCLFTLIMQGSAQNDLKSGLFLAPTAVFIIFVFSNFPNKNKLIYLIENNILNKIRL